MKRQILVAACILINYGVFAQEEKSTVSRVEFNSISFSLGAISSTEGFSNSINDFRKLAPNSTILKQDFSEYDDNEFYSTVNTGPVFSLNTYFSIKNKKGEESKYHPKFRIGISYSQQTLMSKNIYSSEIFRVDTLQSTATGKTYYVDSIDTENYFMEHSSEQLYIDGAFLISSNPENRLMFYGGLGFSLGFSFNSQTFITNNSDNYLESGASINNNNNFNSPFGGDYKEELFLNEEGFRALVSVPIGVELKFSNKDNAWNNCKVYVEGRPSISYATIERIGSNLSSTVIWGTGFKYDF
ncbi:MAG: hypothetical protein RJQ00_02105 [Vicingaceae bacterium]